MAAFVCIIILAYSKRQQSQYWIACPGYIACLLHPFENGRNGTAHVSSITARTSCERLYSFGRIFNSKRRQRCNTRGGNFPPNRQTFSFDPINVDFAEYSRAPAFLAFLHILNKNSIREHCSSSRGRRSYNLRCFAPSFYSHFCLFSLSSYLLFSLSSFSFFAISTCHWQLFRSFKGKQG